MYQQQPGYGGPPPGQGGPPPGYGGPPPVQGGPPPGYGGPQPGQGGPPPGYGGPPPVQGGPPPGYGGPPPGQGGPPPGFGGPPPGQGGPPPGFGGPPPGQGGPPPGQGAWTAGQGGPHQWDNLPQQPMADNPNATASGPPVMAMDGFRSFQGYEQVGAFGQCASMPPPPPPPPPSGEAPKMDFDDIANLDEDACRQALLQFVSENCCYGKAPAQEHKIDKIVPTSALHYILETFTEGRTTGYVHEPFRGQPIDGPENGIPPPPWAIPCDPNDHFQPHTKQLEVPHTATVKTCHHCSGRGFNRCHRCGGLGHVRCGSCGGDGRTSYTDHEGNHRVRACGMCGGDGRRRCYTCGGDGRVTCTTCNGHRQLKCYIRLTVNFYNHKEDFILETTDMPDELIRDVSGFPIFEQTMLQVWPIIAYPQKEINDNSVRLVEKHKSAFTSERRLNQRQTLRAVAVTEVHYTWDDTKTRYWVYGKEHRVHAPDYPQQCCWGCNIL